MNNTRLQRESMAGSERLKREKRLYEASLNGSVDSLKQLLVEDPLTLARAALTCYDETPLHVALMLGHLDFAKFVVTHKPDMAIEVDSQGRSPLHFAAANGYVEMVNVLVSVNPNVCLFRDEDGRTPLHLAVMKGRVDVIRVLVRCQPEVIRFRLVQGETLVHLAVKQNQLGALKLLIELGRDDDDLVNVKDDHGNTILHIAAGLKQTEVKKQKKY